jgi:hypothetical protein
MRLVPSSASGSGTQRPAEGSKFGPGRAPHQGPISDAGDLATAYSARSAKLS